MLTKKKNESFWIHPGFVADPVSHVPTQPDGRVSCGVSDYAIHHLFFGCPQVVGPISFHDRGVRPCQGPVCGVPQLVFLHRPRKTLLVDADGIQLILQVPLPGRQFFAPDCHTNQPLVPLAVQGSLIHPLGKEGKRRRWRLGCGAVSRRKRCLLH